MLLLIAGLLMAANAFSQSALDAYEKSHQDRDLLNRQDELAQRQHELAMRKLGIEHDQLVLDNPKLGFKEREAAAKRIALAKYPGCAVGKL